MWVQSRQYTGRVVTVSNAKVFDEPVYNYSRDFPYVWEELRLPIAYTADRAKAEDILLDTAAKHTLKIADLGEAQWSEMQRRYLLAPDDLLPRVYYRLTDNWLELTVRFLTGERGTRDVKDAMSRDILKALDAVGIGIASATIAITEVPTLRVQQQPG